MNHPNLKSDAKIFILKKIRVSPPENQSYNTGTKIDKADKGPQSLLSQITNENSHLKKSE